MNDEKYVGIDTHEATLVIEVQLKDGATMTQAVVATNREAIVQFFRGLTGRVYVAFEEGTQAQWLHDLIEPLVARVVVCNERGRRKRENKGDRVDANSLATRLRMNDLKPVYHKIGSVAVLKPLVRGYVALVNDRTRTKLRLKAVFRSEACATKGKELYRSEVSARRGKELGNSGSMRRVSRLARQIEFLETLIAEARDEMIAEAKRQPAYRLLDALPFFGPIRVSQLLATMVSPWRFRTKRQLWAMSGLSVVTWGSSEFKVVDGVVQRKKRAPMTRGLNPNHNPVLKDVFRGAANDAAVRKGPLRDFYLALIEKGMRPEMAKLTLARKIAAYTLRAWKKGESFDPKKLTTSNV